MIRLDIQSPQECAACHKLYHAVSAESNERDGMSQNSSDHGGYCLDDHPC